MFAGCYARRVAPSPTAAETLAALARSHGSTEIVAVATSATREAQNQGAFVHRLRDEAGIDRDGLLQQTTGAKKRVLVEPMQLIQGDEVLTLKFDCKPCEMHVIGKMKGHIIDLPTPGSAVAQVVGHISPEDLLKTIPRAPH